MASRILIYEPPWMGGGRTYRSGCSWEACLLPNASHAWDNAKCRCSRVSTVDVISPVNIFPLENTAQSAVDQTNIISPQGLVDALIFCVRHNVFKRSHGERIRFRTIHRMACVHERWTHDTHPGQLQTPINSVGLNQLLSRNIEEPVVRNQLRPRQNLKEHFVNAPTGSTCKYPNTN